MPWHEATARGGRARAELDFGPPKWDFGPYVALPTRPQTRRMAANSQSTPLAGDMSRRVARRREELGLTVEDLAERTGINPGYLQYFEENAGARLSEGSTQLLALALDTTPVALRGGRVDWPTGGGRPGPHPQLQPLSTEQCEVHLAAGGIGRVIFSTDRGPIALPVNYEYTAGEVVISTDTEKAAALESQNIVGFEIDRIDDVMSEGWSVLVTGTARRVDDPEEIDALSSTNLESWAGDDRHSLVAIRPKEITGRVIVHPVISVE